MVLGSWHRRDTRATSGPGPCRRAWIVAAYTLVFWLLLPALLFRLSVALDAALDLGTRPAAANGWLLLAAGLGLLSWSTVELWRRGGGLPVSALPPPRLVRSGPYGFVRHPIYLGFNAALLGAGLVLGSPALAWIIAPAFLPLWAGYARIEEHFLERRLGRAYRRYRQIVGIFPRVRLYGLGRLAVWLRLLPVRVEGRENILDHGPAVLVGNHTCYLDCIYLAAASRRNPVYFVTAEVFRNRLLAWLMRRFHVIPVRRYRTDPNACREMLRRLDDGEVVAVFPEGERSPLGELQAPFRRSAEILARLPCPVVPVGIHGAYDAAPRWAGVLRRRPVTVRIGTPVAWSGEPAADLMAALRALLPEGSEPVHLAGLPLERLARVLWRCPACAGEEGWLPAALACRSCGARWKPTACGFFTDGHGRRSTLAALARPVWSVAEAGPIRARATAWREASLFGPILPLIPLGEGMLEAGPHGLRFEELMVPIKEIRSLTTERADVLQVATARAMWQFRPAEASVFRMQQALVAWGCGR